MAARLPDRRDRRRRRGRRRSTGSASGVALASAAPPHGEHAVEGDAEQHRDQQRPANGRVLLEEEKIDLLVFAVLEEENDDQHNGENPPDQCRAWSTATRAGGLTWTLVRVVDVLDAHGWHSLVGFPRYPDAMSIMHRPDVVRVAIRATVRR